LAMRASRVRSLLRFVPRRVRWLLALTAVVALLLSFLVAEPLGRKRRATDLAKRLGGYASLGNDHLDHTGRDGQPEQGAARPPEQRGGPELARDVALINLDGRPVADADLAMLGNIPGLRILLLNGTPVTDASLRHLAGLRGLQKLELRETAIGDVGLS